ncbi:hypothetical protein D3C84_1174070 [compost metagenome]
MTALAAAAAALSSKAFELALRPAGAALGTLAAFFPALTVLALASALLTKAFGVAWRAAGAALAAAAALLPEALGATV